MRSVRDIPVLENIPVMVRTSLNVPVENGTVTNAFRLRSAVPTIQFLQQKHARVILVSHITGKGTESLKPMYEAMRQWVPNLSFCPVATGTEARAAVRALPPGHVVMLENLRRNPGEEKNDSKFAQELASLADVFVQDSFDVCHRKHASVVGVPELLPSYAGFTVEAEVTELAKALKPTKPSLAIIGGAKFATKEALLKQLLSTYEHIFVGGALANDFLKASGRSVGASLVSNEGQEDIKKLLTNPRIVIPEDVIVAPVSAAREQGRVASLDDVREGEAVYDVGPKTQESLAQLAQHAKSILWNGPLGFYENGFTDGTLSLARAIAGGGSHSVVGGGDTIAAIETLGLSNKFSFISTGGGAMLDFLADGTLPGLDALT